MVRKPGAGSGDRLRSLDPIPGWGSAAGPVVEFPSILLVAVVARDLLED
jgi:hypothetical protein